MHKVLVVEDESVIRTALCRLLDRNGFSVAEAGSVQEAENKHSLSEFNLIHSSIRQLPGPMSELIISLFLLIEVIFEIPPIFKIVTGRFNLFCSASSL